MGRPSVAVRSSDKQEINLRELEATSSKSVYVLNASPRAARGEIIFSVPRPNGVGEDIVRIPKTWIPIDLTDQVEKRNLLESSRFRLNITKKLITLLHPDYAEKILDMESARTEKERIDNMRSANTALMRANPVTEKDEEEEDDDKPKTPTTRRRASNLKQMEEDNAVTATHRDTYAEGAAFDILLKQLEDTKNETKVLNALRNEGALKKSELRKVIKKLAHLPKVVAWAERKLEPK